MSADWEQVRAEFPALQHWTFLDTASFGQLPAHARQAITAHFDRRDEYACADFLDWFDDADRIRELIARLIHCEPADVAFVPNAATALALLMGGIDLQPGDRIVTLEGEFPNNIYSPALRERRGVQFIETSWEEFYDAIGPTTRLVALSTVNYTTGFRPPLEEISRFLRERGVLLYLDGTQSVGALQFDASAIHPAMLAVHGYKWLLAPNGAGFLYVHPELRRRLEPSVIGWRSHREWRRVDSLHHGAPDFKSEAEKYEGGMLTFAVLYAMGASIEMMLEIGPAAIEQRVLQLADYCRAALRRLGARLSYDEAPHFDSPVIAARFDNRDAAELGRRLKERRILVSARHGYLRVSTHFYNHEADIDRLESELRALL